MIGVGHAPTGLHFLLLAQKKCNQRERTPRFAGRPIGRLPCVAHHAGRWIRTRATRYAATRSNMNPATAPAQLHYLRYSAARRGPKNQNVSNEAFPSCQAVVYLGKANKYRHQHVFRNETAEKRTSCNSSPSPRVHRAEFPALNLRLFHSHRQSGYESWSGHLGTA